jgi:hypothetical protein
MTAENNLHGDSEAPSAPRPVEIIPCPNCHGAGHIEYSISRRTGLGEIGPCCRCLGRGFVATNGGEA